MFVRQQLDQPGLHRSTQEVMRLLQEQSEEYTLAWYPGQVSKHAPIKGGRLQIPIAGMLPVPTEELVFQYCRLSEHFRYVKSVTIQNDEIIVVISGPPELD